MKIFIERKTETDIFQMIKNHNSCIAKIAIFVLDLDLYHISNNMLKKS